MHATRTDAVSRLPEDPESVSSVREQVKSPAWYTRLLEKFRAFLHSVRVRRRIRSLQICESLPLGEKRLIAVVQVEGRRFLIGATNQSISLLDRLDSPASRTQRDRSQENSYLSGVH
jgi:flagellar biogenesis protein FliO